MKGNITLSLHRKEDWLNLKKYGNKIKINGIYSNSLMACEEIQTIIPRYVAHDIEEEQMMLVEEHLCVCNTCRIFLSQHIDKPLPKFDKKKITEEAGIREQKNEEKALSRPHSFPLEYIVLSVGALVLFLFIYLLIKS